VLVVGKLLEGADKVVLLPDRRISRPMFFRERSNVQKVSALLDGHAAGLLAGELTVSGNEITDAVRAAGTVGDGRGYAQVTNLVLNGGFETNTTGWAQFGTATLTRDAAQARYGTRALKVDVAASANGAEGAGVAVFRGGDYTLSAWAYHAAGSAKNVVLGAQEYAGGSAIGGADHTRTESVPSGVWTRIRLPFAANGAAVTTVKPRVVSGAGALVFWADGVMLEWGPVAHDYVETDGAAATQTQRDQVAVVSGAPVYVPQDSSFGIHPPLTNIVANPTFEANVTSWVAANADTSLAREVGRSRFGASSMRVSATGSVAHPPEVRTAGTAVTVGTDLLVTGGVITDAVRATGTSGDARPGDGSMGVWEEAENLEATAGADVSFEAGTTGYTKGGTNTIASSAARARGGAKSCLATYSNHPKLLSIALVLPS
jgi:hypothetical protein